MHDWYHNKSVLVTGAAGFIGSHLVEVLIQAGARVVGVDNFLTGSPDNVQESRRSPQFTFVEADVIGDPATYLPEGVAYDIVFHLASPASPPQYQAHPVETYLVNSLATHQLLSFLNQNCPQARFVFASTSEVYGDPLEHPQEESYWGNVNPNGLRSCYDESKRMGETICGVFARDFEQDVRIVRIFNTYGPRMNLADGRVIPNFLTQALEGQALTIYGTGEQTRSYCYVTDLVDGFLKMGSVANIAGETINLGNPDEFTVAETAAIIEELTGVSKHRMHQELPSDDPQRRKPDITKAKQLLTWEPKTAFREGLALTIADFTHRLKV